MARDPRYTPLWRLYDGQTANALLISPIIYWAEHWIGDRSYVCPTAHCPACEWWQPTNKAGAVVIQANTPGRKWLVAAENSWLQKQWMAPGSLLEVNRRAKQITVSHLGPREGEPPKDEGESLCWEILATMHRLPWHRDAAIDANLSTFFTAAKHQLAFVLRTTITPQRGKMTE